MQEIRLLYRKCRSQRCHRLCESCLVHGNDIHISLAQDNVARPGGPCEIQSVEVTSLIEDHGLRGIQVLRFAVSHDPASEADHPVVNILYREHHPVPKLTSESSLFREHRKSGIFDLFIGKAFFTQILDYLLAVFPGVAQSEMMHSLVGQLSFRQITHSHFSVRTAQHIIKISGCLLIDLQQPHPLAGLFLLFRCLFHFRQLHSRTICQDLDCLRKSIVFILHKKCIYISAGMASEAVIHLLIRRHRKRRCFLVMKRTAAPIVASLFFQCHITGNNIHDIIPGSDFFYQFFRVIHSFYSVLL